MLRRRDRWVWDSWLADTGSEFHPFFLQATRSLGDQVERHFNATVGHAVSTDLRAWRDLGTVLRPGPPGTFEDMATWTGSVIGTYLALGESLLGPWDIAGARRLPVPDLYAARLVRDRSGRWQVIGFRDGSVRGRFAGEITDPIPLRELGLP